MCPKGDDPNTGSQVDKQIRVAVGASSGTLGGAVTLTFDGQRATFPANGNDVDSDCTSAVLGPLDNVDSTATCTVASVGEDGSAEYNITLRFPILPIQNNLHSHDGNPDSTHFGCDTTSVTGGSGVTCNITDLTSSEIKEYSYCSLHGACDFSTGLCACFDGWHGPDCSNDTTIIVRAGPLLCTSTPLTLGPAAPPSRPVPLRRRYPTTARRCTCTRKARRTRAPCCDWRATRRPPRTSTSSRG